MPASPISLEPSRAQEYGRGTRPYEGSRHGRLCSSSARHRTARRAGAADRSHAVADRRSGLCRCHVLLCRGASPPLARRSARRAARRRPALELADGVVHLVRPLRVVAEAGEPLWRPDGRGRIRELHLDALVDDERPHVHSRPSARSPAARPLLACVPRLPDGTSHRPVRARARSECVRRGRGLATDADVVRRLRPAQPPGGHRQRGCRAPDAARVPPDDERVLPHRGRRPPGRADGVAGRCVARASSSSMRLPSGS